MKRLVANLSISDLVVIASLLFACGGFYFQHNSNSDMLEQLRKETMRREVIELKLDLLRQRIDYLEDGIRDLKQYYFNVLGLDIDHAA